MSKLPNIDTVLNPLPIDSCDKRNNTSVAEIEVINEEYPIVSHDTDGLVDQITFEAIVDVLDNIDTNVSKIKIYPALDGHWNYLKSSGDYISIDNTIPDTIKIEVNESKLYSVLSLGICQGYRGKLGKRGPTGNNGVSAPNEPFYNNNGDDGFVIYTPIPIGTYIDHDGLTKINIRIYELLSPSSSSIDGFIYWDTLLTSPLAPQEESTRFDSLRSYVDAQNNGVVGEYGVINLSSVTVSHNITPIPIAEIRLDWDTGSYEVISDNNSYVVGDFNIELLRDIGILKLSFNNIDPTKVVVRCRQMGPNGDRGDIPTDTVNIIECEFDQSNVRPNRSLLNMRMDCNNRVIYTQYGRVSNQEAYGRISLTPNLVTQNTQSPRDGRYLSAPISTSNNRKTAALEISRITDAFTIEPRELVLPTFVPEAGCPAKNHEGEYDFDWVESTDIPACDERLKWFSTSGVRPGKYPFDIIKKESVVDSSEDPCCQDDFYYFPDYNC